MIKNVFLPERSGTYYFFGTVFVGIEITSTEVHVVQVRAHGNNRTIEKSTTVSLSTDANIDWHAKAVTALRAATVSYDMRDYVVTPIASSQVIMKRMRVPFTDSDKITQIIGFEVEPLLPFPLTEALIDCVILQVLEAEKSTEVLIVAVQKERIEKIQAIFSEAGIVLTGITVDILSVYNLIYRLRKPTDGAMVFITTGAQTTGVACMIGQHITLTRSIPKGALSIAKQIGTKKNVSAETALAELMRFGTQSHELSLEKQDIQSALQAYVHDLKFTCAAFATEIGAPIQAVMIMGPIADIPGFIEYATKELSIPCSSPDVGMLTQQDPSIQYAKAVSITPHQHVALGTALPLGQLIDFNIIKAMPSSKTYPLFIKQTVVMLVLLSVLFGILGFHFYLQRRSFTRAISKNEQEVIAALKAQFSSITSTRIERVIEDAQEAVDREESTWFAFSSAARASYLKILLELKSKIDTESLGFVIDRLTITEGQLTIKAHVRDYNALKLLEKALRSSTLLMAFEPQATTDFEMKITLASPSREEL
jgi:type IV pilus assembly protein PilM